MNALAEGSMPAVLVLELWPHESECCICGKPLVGCRTAIAMYEGCAVPDDWPGDWAGFDACEQCYQLHALKLLPTWPHRPNKNLAAFIERRKGGGR